MTRRAKCYELYGLRIRSEVPLSSSELASEGLPDVEVSWGERRAVPSTAPDGKVLARFSWQDGRGYTLTERATGYSFRVHSICEFDIASDRRSISVHLDGSADPEMASLLLGGNVLSIVLGLAGECVLHASAVEIDGLAVACLGGTGAGKSTLAALLCEVGAELVTDDVLRIDFSGSRVTCFTGPVEVRLRAGAAELADKFISHERKPTADQRLAIRLRGAKTSKPELRAVVIPRPSRDTTELRITKQSRHGALLELLRYPRIIGWEAEGPLRGQFRGISRLARTVPVFSADIPWGPPFEHDLGSGLLRGVGVRS